MHPPTDLMLTEALLDFQCRLYSGLIQCCSPLMLSDLVQPTFSVLPFTFIAPRSTPPTSRPTAGSLRKSGTPRDALLYPQGSLGNKLSVWIFNRAAERSGRRASSVSAPSIHSRMMTGQSFPKCVLTQTHYLA